MKIEAVASKLKTHTDSVSPGNPTTLGAVHQHGDGVWQGDLGIEIVSKVPPGYVQVENPTDADRQLVPEGGQGSHHRLRSFDGVKLYRPADWGQNETDLRGPCIVFTEPNAIMHEPGHDKPHGAVNIECPMTVLCRYQRNLASDEREATRAAD